MAAPNFVQVRVPKELNERLKPHAEVLGCSVADLTVRGLSTICDMMEGDERPPLLVEEFKLKLRYQASPPQSDQQQKK